MFERTLRDIISGAQGTFLAESSFISKASDKVVSACLVTASGTGIANVVELFTHPLYRARGLATTEIAMSMNRLRKAHFSTLRVLVKEEDGVARRLFEKLGFKKDLRLVQMAIESK
jgi:predicted GNAT family acetyltransferase